MARLREIAAKEQKAILEQLKPSSKDWSCPLWIVNAIALTLTPDEIRAAAALKEVRFIYPEQDLLPDFPEGVKLSEVIRPAERAAFTTEGKKVPWNLQEIGAERAWTEHKALGQGTVIASLDSGVNYSHEDLRSNLWVNSKETPDNGKDDDGNGYVDDYYGFDFTRMSPEVRATGRFQHGTFTAGIMTGDGTGGTVTGMAPRARLMILRGGGAMWSYALAYQYAIDQGADVMNMSFSIPDLGNVRGIWRMMSEHAVCAGLVLSGGAGNFQKSALIPVQVQSPKDVPCVIAAGGVDRTMKIPGYCSLGPVEWGSVALYGDHPMPKGLVKPDLACFPGPGYPVLGTSGNAGYIDPNTSVQGNSFSGPHASGAAALVLGVNPELPAWKVKEILEATAKDLGEPGKDNRTGAGLMDACAAVAMAKAALAAVPSRP
jgi:subtilisin family serine protease